MIENASVSEILNQKGNSVWSIEPGATVFEAIQLMADKNIGALLVKDGEKLVGVISERDYTRNVILKGKSSRDTPVREIMSSHVLYVRPQHTIEECMALMTEKRVRHLPVLDGDRLVGVVSIGDVVKAIIAEQTFMIEQLQSYITGR